jgi:hypothetical protein
MLPDGLGTWGGKLALACHSICEFRQVAHGLLLRLSASLLLWASYKLFALCSGWLEPQIICKQLAWVVAEQIFCLCTSNWCGMLMLRLLPAVRAPVRAYWRPVICTPVIRDDC